MQGSPLSFRSRTVLAIGTAGVLAVTGTVFLPGSASAGTTLGASAAESGPLLRHRRRREQAQRLARTSAILNREFNMVTPENEMKWDATEPSQNSSTTATPTGSSTTRGRSGMQVRGHALAWHSQQPGWAQNMRARALRNAMLNHVTQVATHFRGKIYAWDVVNEAFADGSGGGRRDSNLQRTGNDWIEAAFRAARAADPGAKLCYNDYNTDDWTTRRPRPCTAWCRTSRPAACRSTASASSRTSTASRRYPVNYQHHAVAASPPSASTCRSPSSTSRAPAPPRPTTTQRRHRPAWPSSRCTGITVWGIRDSDSWRASQHPAAVRRQRQQEGRLHLGAQRPQQRPTADHADHARRPAPPTAPADRPADDPAAPGGGCSGVGVAEPVERRVRRHGHGHRRLVGDQRLDGRDPLPSGAAITNAWSATAAATPARSSSPTSSYNGRVDAGQSTEFGFQGTGTGPASASGCSAT